jgi:voltage-gated potassium channel Kch
MTEQTPLPSLEDVIAEVEDSSTLVTRATYKIFIVFVTLLSLTLTAFFYLAPLSQHAREVLYIANFINSLILLFDFGVRLINAPHKRAYLLPLGICDLLGSLPFVPILRLFRIPALVIAVRQLRHTTPREVLQTARERLAESTLLSGIIIVFLVVTIGGTAMVAVEEPAPGSNIKNGGDALWFAIVTISTVGYGDLFPVTAAGRAIGAVMIVVGVGIFSVLTGYISTQFLSRRRHSNRTDIDLLREHMDAQFIEQRRQAAADRAALEAQLAELRKQLENSR